MPNNLQGGTGNDVLLGRAGADTLGDDQLAAMLKGVPDGSRHRFRIGEREGVFEKMKTGKNGMPTDGFKPVGEIRDWWQRSKYDATGSVVPFAYLGPDE